METTFNLQGIELLSFSLLPEPSAGRGVGEVTYEFNIQQEQKTNVNKKLVIVFTTVKVMQPGSSQPLAAVTAACGFGIPSFDTTVTIQASGEYLLQDDYKAAIARTAIGVIRGMLYSLLRGSYLQDFILPLLPGE